MKWQLSESRMKQSLDKCHDTQTAPRVASNTRIHFNEIESGKIPLISCFMHNIV